MERAETYSYDSVFAGASGCKAIVVIHELSSMTYGDRNVSAIVQFPTEAAEQLRRSTGQKIAFTGKLLKVDALLRNIYIADGAFANDRQASSPTPPTTTAGPPAN